MPKTLKCILFDLDETLYPSQSGLMIEIGSLMGRYMEERLGMSPIEVPSVREHYYRTYGTTMRGLQIHHGIDPEDYLTYVHKIQLEDYIGPNDELDRVLAEIEMEKVVFTNASKEHARRVLKILGIERHFNCIIDVRALGYMSKPDPEAYRRALEILGVEGNECLIIDDRARNLAPAKELGMITVLVSNEKTVSPQDQSLPGKCSEPRPRGDFRKVASLATPPRTGAESVFKDFPGDLDQLKDVDFVIGEVTGIGEVVRHLTSEGP